MRPQVGEIINGKYRLIRLIGEGGMGSVFEARHEYLGQAVALKFLNAELAQRPGLVARFLQEARVSASIRSPFVVHVSDVDQSPHGLPYLVMELVEGESLQRMLSRLGKLPIALALDFALQILNGLEAAHAAHVVHRDLKPDNALVVATAQGPLVKLLDFGIAKLRTSQEFQQGLTHPGSLMGTPEYMAPEQAFAADSVDHRADIYAAGIIVFEMITGRRPVVGDDPRAMAARVIAGQVPSMLDFDPTVPAGLSAAVQRALAGRPEDRYGSVAEMRAALLPFCSSPAQPGAPAYPGVLAFSPPPAGQYTALLPTGGNKPPATQPGSEARPQAGSLALSSTLPPQQQQQAQAAATPPAIRPTGTVLGNLPETADMTPPPADFGSTAQMAPMMFAPGAAGPGQPAYSPQPPVQLPPTMPTYTGSPRPSRNLWAMVGLGTLIVGTLVGAGVVTFVLLTDESGRSSNQPPISLEAGAGPVVINPTDTPTTPAQNTVTVPPTAPPTTPATPPPTTTHPPRRDAGAEDGGSDGGDAGKEAGAFPFPIPSGLIPPIPVPSGLPGLPSGFPPLPIPGWGN